MDRRYPLAFLLSLLLFSETSFGLAKPPGCAERRNSEDGTGGFLWKESETGGLVILFPESDALFDSVVVSKKRKLNNKFRVLSRLQFSSFANGNRQHWRDRSKPASSFPTNSWVIARGTDRKICYRIARPSDRID